MHSVSLLQTVPPINQIDDELFFNRHIPNDKMKKKNLDYHSFSTPNELMDLYNDPEKLLIAPKEQHLDIKAQNNTCALLAKTKNKQKVDLSPVKPLGLSTGL